MVPLDHLRSKNYAALKKNKQPIGDAIVIKCIDNTAN